MLGWYRRAMKLQCFWLGPALIVLTYGETFFSSSYCGNNLVAKYNEAISFQCNCGHNRKRLQDSYTVRYACCPSHNETCFSEKYGADGATCPNGVIQKSGSYCKSSKQCLDSSIHAGLYTSIPCKMSDSDEYSCTDRILTQKVCRGTLTACKRYVLSTKRAHPSNFRMLYFS